MDVKGEILELKDTINTMVDQLRSFAAEVTRVAREVGTEGKLGGQADVKGVAGTWKDLTDSVNSMAGNLTAQVRNIAEVTKAVAAGDLSKKITVDVKGEILELKATINTMVDQLRSFAAEVTRVAREVGTEGKLGGQAQVPGVAGTWKDLTDSVNSMAGNLTSQVRGIAKVVTAVANGDLKLKLTVDAKGEIAALADTINSMIDTLATFADQVTTVAREVGVEGKLGGQAKVPGAAGTWKDLTENVNQLAANLTTQVRAIAEVATAVTQGDLTRSITVETQGEVAALKDTINEMIRNLRDSTQKNTEQDWLKTNLAKFSRMLQGQRDLTTVGRLILSELAPVVSAQHAEFYVLDSGREDPRLTLLASYASQGQLSHGRHLELGEGVVGQCGIEKQKIVLENVPDGYIKVSSGLGEASPRTILVLPVVFEGALRGVLELATLERFTPMHHAFLDQLTESIGIVLNTIQANMRTEDLLTQSQSLAQELQQTNKELQEKARLLAHQNQEVERKNQEVEQARQALEEKAKQLALTSKYKSEFLANMSHELRTPLNSLLILSDQLSKNHEGNLTAKQTEFAKTIHSSGNDLLMLINDILDLSKIESGTVVVDVGEVRLGDLNSYVERTFRHVAESKNLDFGIHLDPRLPKSMFTDAKRLQQVLKNLLSNAFKFTHHGRVTLGVEPVLGGWNPENDDLNRAGEVLAFSVSDTGIGIATDKQQIIFEAFQQADGSTSRKYGGTGLGLAISRELSRLLGGEIRLVSTPGQGSTFTLFLPMNYAPRTARKLAAFEASQLQSPAPAGLALPPRPEAPRAPEPGEVPAVRPTELEVIEEAAIYDEVGDDRLNIGPGDRVILIVENDLGFARVLLEAARQSGFKGLVTSLGAAALSMARDYKPHAITLDIFLPDIAGWRVLDRLKNDLATRHIPVCVISTDDARERALTSGALAFVAKPLQGIQLVEQVMGMLLGFTQRDARRVLVLASDEARRHDIAEALSFDEVSVTAVDGLDPALKALESGPFDCLVAGQRLDAAAAADLAEVLASTETLCQTPVIVYADDVDEESAPKILGGTASVRRVRSPERLLDQVMLVLHRKVDAVSEHDRRVLENLHGSDTVLKGKKVLIVDDDMRNIFALATVLEEHEMEIVSADNGHAAIDRLRNQPDVDIVLMDIMMPEMDGIDTMREIRKMAQFRNLPIVAVTAKAMKGDREKCIEAGAWDYLAKPVDTQQLLAVLRAWLHR
ncbi:MAG TPA: response regulator [Phycisphaerales bacterium]|nr:response regulator [Phycisphaerales bacterium]